MWALGSYSKILMCCKQTGIFSQMITWSLLAPLLNYSMASHPIITPFSGLSDCLCNSGLSDCLWNISKQIGLASQRKNIHLQTGWEKDETAHTKQNEQWEACAHEKVETKKLDCQRCLIRVLNLVLRWCVMCWVTCAETWHMTRDWEDERKPKTCWVIKWWQT